MKTDMFALRHKETGAFMPLLPNGRGYSHWEPGNEGTGVVRLFPTEHAARTASTTWALGVFSIGQRYSLDWGDDCSLVVDPVPGRYKGQLEVVRATIVLGSVC